MSNTSLLISSLLVFSYPFIHNFLVWLGSKLLKDKNFFAMFIRFINLCFFPIACFIFYLFVFGDFSILFGFKYVSDISWLEKHPIQWIWYPLFIALPIFLFIASILYGVISLLRIKNPYKVKPGKYD